MVKLCVAVKVVLIGGNCMGKEFEIAGCISSVPDDMSCDEFIDIFIDFVESRNWLFGGGINEIIDGYYINEDGTKGKHVLDEY